ncbi:MAG: 3-oxoacyl-ACP synthase III family protein [Spirochaetes bacterium]|nr:3-oxoacyl-ACP synthase III family protein [Spirochaetota bacterium]
MNPVLNHPRETYVQISGSGSFLPGNPVPFDDIDRYLGKITDAPPRVMKWMERMGPLMKEMLDVEQYHYAIDPVTREFTEDNVTMSVKAACEALAMAGIDSRDIELIVYGSAHMDQMPTPSVRIQEALGIERCAELSIHANCTSAYKALLLAGDLLRNGRYRNALVLSSGISSSELRAEYYNQPLIRKEDLFLRWFLCDGAGALVLESRDMKGNGLYLDHTYMESVGGKKPSSMGNRRPAYWMNPRDEYERGYHHLSQMFQHLQSYFHDPDGTVFAKGLKRMIDAYHIDLSRLRFFQVNLPSKHISDLVLEECAALGIPAGTLYTKIAKMGYSGPPMVFICLDRILREEKLVDGDLILSFVTEVSKFMQAGYALTYFGKSV